MALILKITDGTRTIDLNNITQYAIPDNTWAPNVARRQMGGLGGRGVYEVVEELIPVHVRGSTGAAALANLADIGELLDQAESWARGENVDAVKLHFRPNNSNLSDDLEAIIYGSPDRSAFVGLSAEINSASNFEIPGVQINLVRGDWLVKSAETKSSGSVTNPGIMTTATFTAVPDFFSPTRITIDGFDGSVVPSLVEGFVLLADDADAIFLDEAEDGTNLGGGGGLGTISDTAVTGASGGNVVRIAPTNNISTFLISFTLTGSTLLNGRNVAFYAMIKNNSPDITYTAYALARHGDATYQSADIRTRKITIPAASGPQMYYLGMVSLVEQPYLIRYAFAPDDATVTTGDELDVDYCAAISLEDPGKRVLRTKASNRGNAGTVKLVIDHRATDRPVPTVWMTDSSNNFLNTISYGGDPFYVSKGSTVSALVLGTNGSGNWVVETSGGAADSLSISADRRQLYLVGE